MELRDVLRTTFSAREFTAEDVPDSAIAAMVELARFAPSGGNRQGERVIVVRDPAAKAEIAHLAEPAAKRYLAQLRAGENPWNTVIPTAVTEEAIDDQPVAATFRDPYLNAPVILVVCVDLRVVASVDSGLDRVGVVSGASIYPFVWSLLLAARDMGYGGTLTTMPIGEEPALRALLGIPDGVAVAAVIPLGRPVKQLAKLRRRPVREIATRGRWDGGPLEG
jgi:nitroreductase